MPRRKFSYNLVNIFLCVLLLGFVLFTANQILTAYNFYSADKVKSSNINFAFLFAFFVLLVVAYIFLKRLKNFFKGDIGEEEIKFTLDKLQGYSYLSDVMIEGDKGNIDTVLIGPTGIWTIEVKNQTERVIIHDKYLDEATKQAYAEKMSLQNFLLQNGISTFVTPILVYANKRTRSDIGMRPINGVYVIGRTWLEKLIAQHQTGYLSPEQCLKIKQLLRPKSSIIN